jgi:tetratricopeptide (TPR) repeat protein
VEMTIEQALQRAVKYHKAGKLQDAESLYRAILQAQPTHPDANHNLGVIAVSLNNIEDALQLFKTALETNPNQGQFWLSSIDALIKDKQFVKARNVLNQGKKSGLAGEKVDELEADLAASLLAQSSETSANKISTYTQQRKKVSAKKEKKKYSSSNKTSLNSLRCPSQMQLNVLLEHYQKGRYDLAESLAKEITQKYPDHQFGWKVLGAVFKQTSRLQDSLIAIERAQGISPNDAEAHNNLGVTLKELGRLEEAEKSYKKAITIRPDYADAHRNLGITLYELGRLEEAEAIYKKAIAIRPEYADVHCNLGNTLHELGRLEEAETSHKKAIAIKPEFAEAFSNLGNTLHELGRLKEAEISCRKAIAIKPDLADAHSNLGGTLKELGRFEEAEISCRKAITIKPEYAEALSNLGNTLQELGRLEEAETSYKEAIGIKPEFAQAHYNLGILLYETDRYDQAAKVLKLIKFKNSQSYLLRCLYLQNKKVEFYELLDDSISQGDVDPIIGSLTCRAEIKYGLIKRNYFCQNPFQYVLKIDLGKTYDFSNTFIRPVTTIFKQNKIPYRLQKLLANGSQTPGNLFDIERDLTDEIEKTIRIEIEKYRTYFKDSEEGFIKKWPAEYSLKAWLIKMKSGGKLRPHMHENGWISGSIYINVPPKSKTDSGNLVVCIDDQDYLADGKTSHEKIIDVNTGSMCLFPASLLHYTIPFESEEERIVLAFDVVPKSS